MSNVRAQRQQLSDARPTIHRNGVGPALKAVEDKEGSMNVVLERTIRRWAKRTPVDDFRRRGVTEVRTVSMKKVAALLEKAVNRTLIERTLAQSDSDGSADITDALSLSAGAREHFLELTEAQLAGRPQILDGPQSEEGLRERATSTLDRLKRELAERRRALAGQERMLSTGDFDSSEEQKIEARLSEILAARVPDEGRGQLEEDLKALIRTEMRGSRKRVRMAVFEEHQREVAQLERRISKLSLLLGETEEALRQLKLGQSVDPGVSSIFATVQGLDGADNEYEQKSTLMRCIFEANLELRAS